MGKSLAIPCKFKHTLTGRPSNSTPMYLPKKNKNICPQKDLHKNVHNSFIHKTKKTNPKPGANGCPSTGEWNSKLWCIHTQQIYNSVIKRNKLSTTGMNPKNIFAEKGHTQKLHIIVFYLYDVL